MSEIIVVLLILIPVLLVFIVLSYSHKKKKKKTQAKILVYLHGLTNQLKIKHSFVRCLPHQMVLIDKDARILVVVDHKTDQFSHKWFSLDDIKSLKVINLKQTIPLDDKSKRPDIITTEIGVEICLHEMQQEIFLTVYDHTVHHILQMAELEKEAWQIHECINKYLLCQQASA